MVVACFTNPLDVTQTIELCIYFCIEYIFQCFLNICYYQNNCDSKKTAGFKKKMKMSYDACNNGSNYL